MRPGRDRRMELEDGFPALGSGGEQPEARRRPSSLTIVSPKLSWADTSSGLEAWVGLRVCSSDPGDTDVLGTWTAPSWEAVEGAAGVGGGVW